MDVILLGEALNERALERAEVGNGEFEDLRRLLARNEKCGLGILVLLRLALCEGAFRASVLWLAIVLLLLSSGEGHVPKSGERVVALTLASTCRYFRNT
jgi:hypothetical protein